MPNYHVTHKNGSWGVLGEGNSRISYKADTKKTAIEVGRALARKNQCELIIHGLNGRIQDKDSYGRDPYPPKDYVH